MVQSLLGKLRDTLDRENRRQTPLLPGLRRHVPGYPVHECGGFFSESNSQKGVHGEGCIPDPGEPVVPVATAAYDLGKARGRRGNDCAGGLERQKLQRQSRPFHLLAPAAAVSATRDPLLPESDGRLKYPLGFFFGGDRTEPFIAVDRSQYKPLRFSFIKHELGGDSLRFGTGQRHTAAKRELQVARIEDGRCVLQSGLMVS